jgi:hypothetical protein
VSNNSKKKQDKKSIIETAKSRFQAGFEADSKNRELALEDMQFRAGNQWPEKIKSSRALDGRPCLTINKIPQNVHQITNEQRQNRPAIKVNPFDDNADPDTAKVIQGIIRNIENNSNADTAYDVGFDASVTGGRGYFRITTDYCDAFSFDQDIKIKPIHNPNSVVLDPSYKEPDGSDANWGFLFEDMPSEDFKAQFPKAKASEDGFDWKLEQDTNWFNQDSIRVAEYFEKIYEDDKLLLLPDGSTALKSDIDKMDDAELFELELSRELIEDIATDKKTYRETAVPKIMWYKICGNEILEQTEWPSAWIPIIPIHGEELYVDGKRVFEGIVRHAKDPQRMYNYWATCETESIALAPKAPYVGAEGQFEGHEEKWNTAHSKNWGFLEYKPTLLANGQAAPAPQRQFGEPNVQAITQARMLASDDLKSTTGIYDASLGNRSNEASGIAISRRTLQAQTGNFHFMDNLSRSISHGGRILVDLIPKIYDTKRVVRIIGDADEQEIVTINSIFKDKDGNPKEHKLNLGKYDVSVEVGPSYSSKRQEAVESMLRLSQANPQMASLIGDLMVKNMDWPGADEIAERLKRTIDPNILGEASEEIPPQVQAQMQELQNMVGQLSEALENANDQLNDKKIQIESKERIEFAKLENQLRIKQAELQVKNGAEPEDLQVIAQEILDINDRLDLLNIESPMNQDEIADQLEAELQAVNNLPGESTPEINGEMPGEA